MNSGIPQTAQSLSEHDALMTWRLKGQFGYPRTPIERLGATSTYLKLLDQQLSNVEELQNDKR